MLLACLAAAPPALAVVPPSNSSPPTTSGPYQAGRLLHGHPGTWESLTTISYAYRWCRISGPSCVTLATTQNYTARAADIGSRLKFVVTATNSFGSTQRESAPTPVIATDPPDNTSPPAFSGSARQGELLRLTSYGAWSNPEPTGYSVEWLRCNASGAGCTEIPAAGAGVYELDVADVGSTIRLRVRAGGPYGDASATSAASPVVAGRPAPRPRRARRLSPFPKIVIVGALSPFGAVLRQVVVRGPRNVTVRVRCRGGGCPFRKRSYRMRRRRLRLRALERRFRAGAVIELRVVKRGRVGKYTRIRIRRGRVPSRVDRCLNPGSSRPRRCR